MKKALLYIIFTVCVSSIFAESDDKTVNFTLEVAGEVVVGEKFQLAFKCDNPKAKDFKVDLTRLKNATLLSGPSMSYSTSTSFVNGKSETSGSVTNTYILEATKAGTISVPQAEIVVEGKTYKTKEIKVKVVADKSGKKKVDKNEKGVKSREIVDGDLFIKTDISKTTLGIGESTTISYKLYTKVEVQAIRNFSEPYFLGLSARRILEASEKKPDIVTYKGKKYNVYNIGSYHVTAEAQGSFKITPVSFTVWADTRSAKEKKNEGELTQRELYNLLTSKDVKSEPVTITVGISM